MIGFTQTWLNAIVLEGEGIIIKLAGQFHTMAGLARAKDVSGLTKSLTAFENSDGAQEIQKAQDELAAAGYKIKNG